jgi:hypothetical protein
LWLAGWRYFMKRSWLFWCVLVAVVLGALPACKKKTKTEPAVAAAESIGVPECDTYLAKYDKCVSEKIPELARPQFKQSIETMRSAWRQAAANPMAKSGLAEGCKHALAAAKTSMGNYGCTW